MGYREGIEDGKQSALQAGFDEGYNHTGVRVGLALGDLRGQVDALITFIMPETTSPKQVQLLEKLYALRHELSKLTLDDLAEPDWEYVQHELEHHACGGSVDLSSKQAEWAALGNRLEAIRIQLEKCWHFWCAPEASLR